MTDPDPLVAAIQQATQTLAAANKALAAVPLDGDRTSRFLRRLDGWLKTMSQDGRRAFLQALLFAWECEYAVFVCTAGEGDPQVIAGEPDASDYLLTICGISQRLSALECTERTHDDVDGDGRANP